MRSCLFVLVAFAACTDQDAVRLEKIKEAVCACETAACTDRELAAVPQDAMKSTHRTQTLAREMMDCIADVQGAAAIAQLKDRVCACTSSDCVAQAQDEAGELEAATSRVAKQLMTELRACAQKLEPSAVTSGR